MIINSNYRQPYDGLQGMGQDKRIVWNRFEEFVSLYKLEPKYYESKTFSYIENRFPNFMEIRESIKSVFNNLKKHPSLPKNKWGYLTVSPEWILIVAGRAWVIYEYECKIEKGQRFYEWRNVELPEDYSNLNKITDCPLIIIEKDWIYLNPDIYHGTWKPRCPKLNPFEVYQNIFSFMAPNDVDIKEPDDKVKIVAHDMDSTSFRRDKGGPTRKRKKYEP